MICHRNMLLTIPVIFVLIMLTLTEFKSSIQRFLWPPIDVALLNIN